MVTLLRYRRVFVVLSVVLMVVGLLPGGSQVLAQDGIKGGTSDAAENGLIDDSTWESPRVGLAAAWDDRWLVQELSTYSVPDTDTDYLGLVWSGDIDAELTLIVRDEGRGGPPEDVAVWTSEEFLEGYDVLDDFVVLLEEEGSATTDGAVLVGSSHAGMEEPMYHYRQSLVNDDGHGVYLLMEAPQSAFVDAMADVEGGFTVEGAPVQLTYDTDALEAAVDGYDAVPYSAEAAGLEDDQSYLGPQCGLAMTWSDAWEVSTANPVTSDPYFMQEAIYLTGSEPADMSLDVRSSVIQSDHQAELTMDDLILLDTDPAFMEFLYGDGTTTEELLRGVDGEHGEVLLAVDVPGMDEPYIQWSHVASTECHTYITMMVPASAFEETWTDFVDGADLMFGDEAYSPILSWEDMEAAIADS